MWYFSGRNSVYRKLMEDYLSGRNSIYRKLMEDYREALKLIGIQQAIIEKTYKLRNKSEETEKEDGED